MLKGRGQLGHCLVRSSDLSTSSLSMPEFSQPWLLLLAVLAPLLVWIWLRGRHRGALRYPNTAILIELPAGRRRLVRWGGAGMRALGLLLMIVALAGPRWPDLRTRIATEGIAMIMVVDVSGSMAEPDFTWKGQRITRLDAVKRAFTLFVAGGEGPDGQALDGRPDDLIGLVTFATRPETSCPLTLSHSALLRILAKEEPRALPNESQTNIGDAIAWALQRLEIAGSRRKVMLLLTDGEHNVPPPALKPRQAAQIAARMEVPIYTIDAGGESANEAADREGSPASAADRANAERILQAVAKLTGGQCFRAHDSQALLNVCRDIDRLERQPIQSFQYRRYYEGYPWFGLAALVFLVGVRVCEMTLWQRVP
jgi:Ca-activated chloride channel homolog